MMNNTMHTTDMRQLLDSMENTIKLQGRARAERRARKAEQEKLMRIASSQMELENMSRKVKGTEDAVQRDQLMGLMG